MRVSELYGLTFKDIDLKNKRIHINKQLHLLNREYVVTSPKSKAGSRTLAMTEEVKKAFANQYTKPRPRTEKIVDGYGGFIFINEQGNPKTRKNLQMSMINIRTKMEKQGIELPNVSPHILRHTFCSRMVDNGIDIKALQIIMGHSDIGTTLNVYTHKDQEDVAKTMEKVLLAVCGNA
jgi:integrase